MVRKLKERPKWAVFKIKLGTDHDVEIARRFRKETDATTRIDANCGWTCDQTIENFQVVKQWNVEFIEQPLLAKPSIDDQNRLFENLALPVIADESCLVEGDVARCAAAWVHVIDPCRNA